METGRVIVAVRAAARVGILLALLSTASKLSGCRHVPMVSDPRSAAPPIDHLVPAFGAWGLETESRPERSSDDIAVEEFQFRTYDDVSGEFAVVRGEVWLPRQVERPPLVVISPILGGYHTEYLECRWFADAAAGRGYASFFLYQDEIILKPDLDGTDLERSLRTAVRDEIKAIDVLATRYSFDGERIASLGISLGGIRAVLLAAAEPRIRAHVICIAGSGLHEIIRDSAEGLVQDYVEERSRLTGLPAPQLFRELEAHLISDPSRVAASVDPRSVLLFLARFDRHVPIDNGYQLHEALGRPELRMSPFGHYSSILLILWVARHTFDFYDARLEYEHGG